MRRLMLWAVLLLALLPATALADEDPLLPARPATAPAYGQQVPLYDDPRFQPWAYTLEGQDWNRADYATLYFWMNQLQVAKAWGLKMGIRTAEYAVHADLAGPLLAPVGELTAGLHQALWSRPDPSLLLGGLALAGLWALWLHLRGRVSRAWGVLGGSALILLLTAVLISSGPRAVQSGITASRGVAVELFGAAAGESNLIARGGDAAWWMLVYEPWLTGELSAQGRAAYRSPDGLDGGTFLAMTVAQRHNACLYNITQAQTNCPWWELDYLPRRMLLSTWTALAGLSVAGALVVLGGSIIVAQWSLLLFLALAPVWLMVALWWPETGIRLVRGVVLRAFGALVAQGMLAAALALFLMLTTTLHTAFHEAGWMLVSVLLTALSWLVIRYRYAWWQPLAVVVERIRQRSESVTARREERSQRATVAQQTTPAFAEVAPAFAVLPESRIERQSTMVTEQSSRARIDPVGSIRPSSPLTVFETQMQRVREEITLRQETQHYDLTLERGGDEEPPPELAPPAPPASLVPPNRTQAQGRPRPEGSRMAPPRPKA